MTQARRLPYQAALRAAQAGAKTINAARAAAYHALPQGVSCKADWAGWGDPWFAATPRQQALLDTLEDLLDGGETDVPRLALKCCLRLEVPESEILRSRRNTDANGDSGYFFDDVLYAIYALEAQETERVFYGLIDRLVQPANVRTRSLVR